MATPLISPATTENAISPPPTNVDKMTPLMYSQKFLKSDLTEHIARQTNLYGMQRLLRCCNIS